MLRNSRGHVALLVTIMCSLSHPMAISVGCNEGGCKARSAEGTARLSAGRLGGREKLGPGSLGDLALTRDQGVVCRMLEGLKGAGDGGGRKAARGDEVELQWEGRARGVLFDESNEFESLVVGGSLRERLPRGVMMLIESAMIRGSRFRVHLRGIHAAFANGTRACMSEAMCMPSSRLAAVSGGVCDGAPHACDQAVEYTVCLRDFHSRVVLPEYPGLVAKTFGSTSLEAVPPEIRLLQDGGEAFALVESRVWWPESSRSMVAGVKGEHRDESLDSSISQSERREGENNGEVESGGPGEEDYADDELFVLGEELKGRSEVVRGMREITFTMGGGAFPPCVYEALRHATVGQRVIMALRAPLVLGLPRGPEPRYTAEIDAFHKAIEDTPAGDPAPALVFEVLVSTFVPWKWLGRSSRVGKAKTFLSWGDELFASNHAREALEYYRSADTILKGCEPDSTLGIPLLTPDAEDFGGEEEDEQESESAMRERLALLGRTCVGRANAHRVLGRGDHAATVALEALKFLPSDPSVLICAALAFQAAGKPQEALQYATVISLANATAAMSAAASALVSSITSKAKHARTGIADKDFIPSAPHDDSVEEQTPKRRRTMESSKRH